MKPNTTAIFTAIFLLTTTLASAPAAAQFNLPTSQPPPECFPGESAAREVDLSTLTQAQANCTFNKAVANIGARGPAMGVLSFVIKFDNGSDSVSAEFANKLAVVANMMSQPNMSKVLLRVEGHASATGAAITNQRLTERRADRVAQILVQRYGISPSRLEPLGYGYDKPGVGRDPAHPDNRRVQFLPLAAKPSP